MNTKLHAVADANGRPIGFFMSAGQVSDYTGAAALLSSLPKAGWLLADRGYDADWFRDALKDKGIKVCIPGRKSRKKAVKYDKRRYKRRNRIEIMFGRLKDWRRVATRYDRCSETFFSAIMLAATVLFWLRSRTRCRNGACAATRSLPLQNRGQAGAIPVSDPKGGLRDEAVCRAGCVAGEDRDLRDQRAWEDREGSAGGQ
jgi:transposase